MQFLYIIFSLGGQIFIVSALTLFIQLTNAGHSDPSQAPAICAQPNSDSILVSHEDCNKFYKCFKGVPYPINCPDNLLWNTDKEYCNWPQNVNCAGVLDEKSKAVFEDEKNIEQGFDIEDRVDIKSTLDSLSEAALVCAANNSEGKHVVHNDCEKFYVCTGRLPVEQTCPDNLHYNPKKMVCDWPENVACSNSFEASKIVQH